MNEIYIFYNVRLEIRIQLNADETLLSLPSETHRNNHNALLTSSSYDLSTRDAGSGVKFR